ncbi:hypothetical protein AGABI1DRAFT_85025 [Agaricus bisporus var. burnettii JB137-S8]|uniref:Epoxide hydrolase N-terminal domain-containing protein n=1 Tax=Agaricus bisporus var. burnettii (strain JB137-S8 / ATCC MYA-4627 / FGSC 10392) TaxID=597362 RepID=K5X7H1_AGABU|nr:uncharacterized protein AGABI1DRAFT_85025 [Agaricus bisporus var. burnettii JB137-S8]EKM79128.1 hypothetical protein AGABI1DRAFT_85025 [Agaricus bisporus var. burnettii JB137-S8]
MSTESPFKISVPDEQISLLKKKLELVRHPDELEEAGLDYGVPLKDMQRFAAYWKDGYDWKKHEAQLNEELPQFTRDIEVEGFGSLNIHYVHKKSTVDTAIPLIFVHGWPGSFLEVRKILPMLIEESSDHPSFHVVALSLPGFGFSEAPKKKGFAISQYAEVCHKLMLALGYNEYVTQGGDWGGIITQRISTLYGGKHAKARHTNFPTAPPPHPLHNPYNFFSNMLARYTPEEKAGLARMEWYYKESSGYYAKQSTKPQTLGYGLADSPVGLLSWIYEGLVNWTDNYPWTDDEVLTWMSIYWFSRAGPAASVRIYYEFTKSGGTLMTGGELGVPTGYSYFPKELVQFPRSWLKNKRLVFESRHEKGGHFASVEHPDLLVGDMRKMFGKGGPAFGVVSSHNGFKQ